MALTIGIVGLPNAGKSTLFNALTKNDVLAANYPFATIEPNVGVVGVPDERLPRLAEVFESAKVLPATVEFVDIAGIVRGASQGEGLGNKFLAHIRESAAICQVTRVFRDEDVTHVDGEVNPANDISTIQTELILADLETVEKAIARLEKESRKVKDLVANLEAAVAAKDALESGTPIIAPDIDRSLLRELSLLTAKPFIYVFNCDGDELADDSLKDRMREIVAPAEAIFLDATYCKARVNRRVVSQAVVIATGVTADGRREVLGFDVGYSEEGRSRLCPQSALTRPEIDPRRRRTPEGSRGLFPQVRAYFREVPASDRNPRRRSASTSVASR